MTYMNDVTLLMADTARTRAYLDALDHAGLRFDHAILVCDPERPRWGQISHIKMNGPEFSGLRQPNLGIDPQAVMERICGAVTVLDAGSVNSPEVVRILQAQAPRMTIFSGFGGELVRPLTLAAAGQMLHLHAGWLPDFRGSTTLYYSYLAEGTMGVSAILLSEEIDAGAILLRKRYPPPPPGTDVDYIYDSAMRADALLEALKGYDSQRGCFAHDASVDPNDGARTYYIVHPLLKHIALTALNHD